MLSQIKVVALHGWPLSVFKIAQHFHNSDLANSAIARVAKRGRTEVEELLGHNIDNGLHEERNLLICISEETCLAQVNA